MLDLLLVPLACLVVYILHKAERPRHRRRAAASSDFYRPPATSSGAGAFSGYYADPCSAPGRATPGGASVGPEARGDGRTTGARVGAASVASSREARRKMVEEAKAFVSFYAYHILAPPPDFLPDIVSASDHRHSVILMLGVKPVGYGQGAREEEAKEEAYLDALRNLRTAEGDAWRAWVQEGQRRD